MNAKTIEILRRHLLAAYPKGVHAVYSGLNSDLRRAGEDPIALSEDLRKRGLIEVRPAKGGVAIRLTQAGRDWLSVGSVDSEPTEPTEIVEKIVKLVLDALKSASGSGKPRLKKSKA